MVFKEYTYRVLLVSAGEAFGTAMLKHLPESEYFPVHTAKSCGEARRILTEKQYDFVLINTPLPDDFGVRLAERANALHAMRKSSCPLKKKWKKYVL